MRQKFRGIAAIGAVAALAFPAMAEAKTYTLNLKSLGKVKGTAMSGWYSGKPFGYCTMKGELLIPNTKQTWTCKGGTVKMTSHATILTNDTKGTWKFTGGTGKFRHLKGGGTFTGTISSGNYRFVGKATF